MPSYLNIRDQDLSDIIGEGINLIKQGAITGFNFDQNHETLGITFYAQYYHNVASHLQNFLALLQQSYQQIFGTKVLVQSSRKWGLFRWMEHYDNEPGNKYYSLNNNGNLTPLPYKSAEELVKTQLVLAKDRCCILTIQAPDLPGTNFILDFMKSHAPKYLAGQLNPLRIDDHSHENPLYILTDDLNQLADKNDFEQVWRIELAKGNRTISSLVRTDEFRKVQETLRQTRCNPCVRILKRYVPLNFFGDY